MAKQITKKLRASGNGGIFHNSREDVRMLAEYCNLLTDTINQLIYELNEVRAEVERYKKNG